MVVYVNGKSNMYLVHRIQQPIPKLHILTFHENFNQSIYDGKTKTFTENWDSKRHLLELSWPI